MENNLFICDCEDIEHQMVISQDLDDKYKEIYVSIHLSQYHNFFQRLWIGIKYVFGKKSRNGNWDVICLDEKKIIKLKEILERKLNE